MTNKLEAGALWYASQGWKIHPVHGLRQDGMCTCNEKHTDPKDIGKHPATLNGHTDATTDPNAITAWWKHNPLYNVGVHCRASGFVVIDIDPRSGGIESFNRLEELAEGVIPETVTAFTGEYSTPRDGVVRGRHLFYRVPDGTTFRGKIPGLPGIDIKYNGYVLLNPSNHFSGVTYEWAEGHAPWEMPITDLPPQLLAVLGKTGRSGGTSSGGGGGDWDFFSDLDWSGEKLDIEALFDEGVSEGSRATTLYAMTCALANKMGTDVAGRAAVVSIMQKFNYEMVSPPLEYDELMGHVNNAIEFVNAHPKADIAKKYAGMGETMLVNVGPRNGDSIAGGTVGMAVSKVGTGDPDDRDEEATPSNMLSNVMLSKDVDSLYDQEGGVIGSRTLTDTGNGRRLVDTYGQILRYTPGLGWFYWNDQYWVPDVEELAVRERTKSLAAVIGAEAATVDDSSAQTATYAWAKQAKSNARQNAAMESAQSDPRIGVPVDYWDSNPYMLGVANGVVDLRTGQRLQGRADLHITRRAPVAYREGFRSQRFQEFLDFATYGDKEYQEWLQRVFGYTLTGLRTYDHMYLVYGPPGSGKNVLVESLVKCLGTKQYAFPLDSMILAQGDGKGNQSDQYHWAELRGRRMIWVDELPESERLKENSVKKLTGSSEISARSPGEKPFTFESQGKLWITTNHRPIITDDAMWRRIRPIPWLNVPAIADPTLKAYLHDPEGGLPAVLAWAVEGAIKLLASKELDAIGWCSTVAEAAEVYRKNEDRMGMFLDERTEPDNLRSTPIKTLFVVYQNWSEDRAEKPMSLIAFTRKLTDRGISISGTGGAAVVIGLDIKAAAAPLSTGHDWDLWAKTAN